VAPPPKRSKKEKAEGEGPDWFWSFPGRRKGHDGHGDADGNAGKERALASLLLFSGVDLWRNAAFAHDGLLWAPAGEDNDGVVVKAMVSDGAYRYRAGALGGAEVTGWMYGAAIMPGLQFKRYDVTVRVFVGVDYQVHRISMFDPGNSLQGSHAGIRAAVELWTEPTQETMITASATISSIGASYAARIAGGWRVFDCCYLGPEAIAFGTPDYSQLRFGIHFTGLKTRLFGWHFDWQGGLGYALDDDGNDGPYARLGVLWRY
jgi:hypothetical protein